MLAISQSTDGVAVNNQPVIITTLSLILLQSQLISNRRQRSNNEKGISRSKRVLSNLPDPGNILKLAGIRDTFYQLLAEGLQPLLSNSRHNALGVTKDGRRSRSDSSRQGPEYSWIDRELQSPVYIIGYIAT